MRINYNFSQNFVIVVYRPSYMYFNLFTFRHAQRNIILHNIDCIILSKVMKAPLNS